MNLLRSLVAMSGLFSITAAAQGGTPLSRAEEISRNASGCVSHILACGSSTTGSLGLGGCTFSDGTYYDMYDFVGTAGQVVDIEVRPLSSTMTNPLIVLVPPLSDSSRTPIIGGAGGAEVIYKLSSTGTWTIAVGTEDVFGAGSYLVRLTCIADPDPGGAQNCVNQYLICNQHVDWSLTAQSCRFSDNATGYQDFEIYGVAGDTVNVTETAGAFAPLFGVLQESTNQYVGSATLTAFTAKQTVTFPATGWYAIVASSIDPQKAGAFSLDVKCFGSGCLEPIITRQPQATTTVKYNSKVSLSFDASGTAPFTYEWVDVSGVLFGSTQVLTTPGLVRNTTLFGVASNVCGSDRTQAANVVVIPAKRRAVRP